MEISISSVRNKLRKQILRLEQGFPQKWIYIERKITASLDSEDEDGVKASHNFIGKKISDIFHRDLLNIYNQKVAEIRPIVGANGAGKTTLLKFKAKEYTNEIAPHNNMFLSFDFKGVTDNLDEFWPIFMQKFIDQLMDEKTQILTNLINKTDSLRRQIKLTKIFKNPVLVDNLLKLISSSFRDQNAALNYFYDMKLDTKTISDFFYGILKLALQLESLVVIAFDELQFLDEIDASNRLLKLFLEKFVRYLMEQFWNEKLYILVSCLENPDLKEWTRLKDQSRNFASIIKGKEIFLGNLFPEEKDAIVNQVADKIGFDKNDKKIFLTKVKSSLMYYLPRDLLKWIARVIDNMDYTGYTDFELRELYEADARAYMKDILKNKDFPFLDSNPKEIGGFNVDIFASASTKRSKYVKKAFGEATMTQKSGMKQKVEKFADWLYRMKGREYNPDKGDFAFFVCPPNTITKATKEVLEGNNIELFFYNSPNVKQIIDQRKKSGEIIEWKPEKEEEEELEPIFVKEEKYRLSDIPGIGPKKEELLRNADIKTLKDLINCNTKVKAPEISGVGIASLNKWKQKARQLLNK